MEPEGKADFSESAADLWNANGTVPKGKIRKTRPGRSKSHWIHVEPASCHVWQVRGSTDVNPSRSTARPSLFLPLLYHFCMKHSHFDGILLGIHNGSSSAIGIWGTKLYQRNSGQMFPELSGHLDVCQSMLTFSVNSFTESSSSFDCQDILIHSWKIIHICLWMTVSRHRSRICQSLFIIHSSPA